MIILNKHYCKHKSKSSMEVEESHTQLVVALIHFRLQKNKRKKCYNKYILIQVLQDAHKVFFCQEKEICVFHLLASKKIKKDKKKYCNFLTATNNDKATAPISYQTIQELATCIIQFFGRNWGSCPLWFLVCILVLSNTITNISLASE